MSGNDIFFKFSSSNIPTSWKETLSEFTLNVHLREKNVFIFYQKKEDRKLDRDHRSIKGRWETLSFGDKKLDWLELITCLTFSPIYFCSCAPPPPSSFSLRPFLHFKHLPLSSKEIFIIVFSGLCLTYTAQILHKWEHPHQSHTIWLMMKKVSLKNYRHGVHTRRLSTKGSQSPIWKN